MVRFDIETFPFYHWTDENERIVKLQMTIRCDFPWFDLDTDHWRWLKRAWVANPYMETFTPPYDQYFEDDIPF